MGRRDFQSTVADALPRVIKEQAKSGVGSIKFTKKDKKTIGKIYLRAGAIYGIELTTYEPSIVNRIITNEYISDKNREQVLNKYQNNLKDISVIEFVLKYQIFPEKPLMSYIKDYFFDAFDELYKWEEVNAEWRPNEEPSAKVLKVPNASPEDVIEKLKLRESYLRENISQEWSIHPRDLDEVRYTKNFDYEDPDYTNYLLLAIPEENQLTIGQVSDYYGLSRFNTKIALFKLWQSGAIDVFHPSGLRYTNRSEEEVQKAQQEARKGNQRSSLPVETEVNEPISVDEPIIEVPTMEEFKSEDIVPEPITEVYEVELTPPTYERETTTEPPAFSEVNPESYPKLETVKHTIEDKEMSDPAPTTAASRLRLIAEQLKKELNGLKQSISDAEQLVTGKEQYVRTLHAERTVLVNRLKELDARITEETSAITQAKQEVTRLQAEYDDSVQLLN
jgi:hypothetical protein